MPTLHLALPLDPPLIHSSLLLMTFLNPDVICHNPAYKSPQLSCAQRMQFNSLNAASKASHLLAPTGQPNHSGWSSKTTDVYQVLPTCLLIPLIIRTTILQRIPRTEGLSNLPRVTVEAHEQCPRSELTF